MSFASPNLQEISCAVHSVCGKVWHVATTGLDTNDGQSWLTPFLTVFKATQVAGANDLILVGDGTFNEGTNKLVLPANCSLKGAGMDRTILQSALTSTGHAFVKPGNNSEVSKLTIAGNPTATVFSAPIGCGTGDSAPTGVVIRDVKITGWSDGFYWNTVGGTVSFEAFNCIVQTNFDTTQHIASAGGTITGDYYNCQFTAVATTGQTNQTRCIVASAGATIRVFGGSLSSNNLSNGTASYAAFATGSTDTIELYRVDIQSIGDATSYDLGVASSGIIRVYNCDYDPAKVSGSLTLAKQPPVGNVLGSVTEPVTLSSSQSFNNTGQSTPLPATYAPPATGTAASSNPPAFNGTAVSLATNYSWSQPFSLTGFDATGWSEFQWTVKKNRTDADSAAVLTIKLTNGGSGSDGLQLINGAAPGGSTTAADGSITGVSIVTGANPTLAFTVNLTARGAAIPNGGFFWEFGVWKGGVKQTWLGTGTLNAAQTLIVSPTQP